MTQGHKHEQPPRKLCDTHRWQKNSTYLSSTTAEYGIDSNTTWHGMITMLKFPFQTMTYRSKRMYLARCELASGNHVTALGFGVGEFCARISLSIQPS